MLPCYGEAVEWKPSGYRIRILDCGADPNLLTQENADGYLLICGGKPWEWENSEEAAGLCESVRGLSVIYNLFCGSLSFRQKQPCAEGLRMSYFENPFTGKPEIGLCVPAYLEPVVWTGRRHVAKRIWGKKKETPVSLSGTRVRVIGLAGCGRGSGNQSSGGFPGELSDGSETKKDSAVRVERSR